MKVREFLTPLTKPSLVRLSKNRALKHGGTTSDLLERLARSYKGDFESLLRDLRRQDLYEIGGVIEEQLHLPIGWRQLRAENLRDQFLANVLNTPARSIQTNDDRNTQLFSSCYPASTSGVQLLSIHSLIDEAKTANRTTIISAYYSIKTLTRLLNNYRGEVRVVLNGLGGRSLESQRKDLLDFQKTFSKRGRIEIKLGFSKGVFHSKLYLFEKDQHSTAWLGSANATSAGLTGVNEEILLRMCPTTPSVIEYVEGVWRNASPVEKCRTPVNSLTSFFRTGLLYYKPYATLQKTFNPFVKWVERLPAEVKSEISLIRSEFVTENGIGAFSFNRAFEADNPRPMPINSPNEHSPPSGARKKPLMFRNYAVETCYGYWVSEKYLEEVDTVLKKRSQHKVNELNAFKSWLERRKKFILASYINYLNSCKEMLRRLEVDPKFYDNEILFEITDPAEKQISVLLKKLSNENRIKHFCQDFVSAQVPEMWEDPTTRQEFEDSFFESLARSGMSDKRSRVALEILNAVEIDDHMLTTESIRECLERNLADDDWYETVFLRQSQ